jgi:uncharacterized protein
MEEKITSELKAAMLARDTLKTNVLRGLKAALKSAEIDKRSRSDEPLSDQEKIDALTKQYKMRMESVLAYEQAGQAERAESERAEAELIKTYLPESIEGAELESLVDEAIASLPAANIGAAIGKVKAMSAGKMIDMSEVAKIINQKLGSR